MISPSVARMPLLSASVCPRSFSDTQRTVALKRSSTARVSSVLPPSITTCSSSGTPCVATLRIVRSMKRPWLNDGVMMLTFTRSGFPGPCPAPCGPGLAEGVPVFLRHPPGVAEFGRAPEPGTTSPARRAGSLTSSSIAVAICAGTRGSNRIAAPVAISGSEVALLHATATPAAIASITGIPKPS